jgi:hypothetical protein
MQKFECLLRVGLIFSTRITSPAASVLIFGQARTMQDTVLGYTVEG